MSLPTELLLSLNAILGDASDLDSLESSFSLEGTLNALFPDGPPVHRLVTPGSRPRAEASLKSLDATQLRLASLVHQQRTLSSSLQRELAASSAEDSARMASLQELIGDLFTQIHHLRSGATESEVVVREITRDIKALDLAKRNIVASMTGVKRFQMLGRSCSSLWSFAVLKVGSERVRPANKAREGQAISRDGTVAAGVWLSQVFLSW
jgi:hypothetical protein